MENDKPKLIDSYEEDNREVEIYEYKGIKIYYNLYYEYEYTIDGYWYSSLEAAIKSIDGKTKVPFNVTKYEEKKFSEDFEKFKKLYVEYKDDIENILEFARLWKKFTPNANKYMD